MKCRTDLSSIVCVLSLEWPPPQCLFASHQLPVTQMRMSVRTARSAGEHHAITPWGASAASVPPASTTSSPPEAVQTSTSAPPATTHASLAAQIQMGVTSVVAHMDTTVPDKGTFKTIQWKKWLTYVFCLTDCFVSSSATVSQVLALRVVDRKVRWMTTHSHQRPAMSVR